MYLNHPETISPPNPHTGLWKNCLPQNQKGAKKVGYC